MGFLIYIVEDDKKINNLLKLCLKSEGWNVRSFYNGIEAGKANKEKPHLWMIDIMLSDIDSFQLIEKIKEADPSLPIIFLADQAHKMESIIGLEKGGDDYFTIPFFPKEVIIKTKKLLERVYRNNINQICTYNSYRVDFGKRTVYNQQNEIIELTSKEFELLSFMLRNLPQALTREQIINSVWGDNYYGSDRVVDEVIRRLRKKLPGVNIKTIYGYGYRIAQ